MFRSFFFAGFEGTTGFNARGDWVDQVAATHHDKHADDDYRRLREVGIHAAREAIRWPLVDRRGHYDFSSVRPFVAASRKHGIEVIWDLFHYGFPSYIDLFSEEFPKRFADYCHAAAKFICAHQEGTCYFTPVNEPSFFAWAGGEVGKFAPHCRGRGEELKIALARAGIAGINAIRTAVPGARIVNVDPLCHVVTPHGRMDLLENVAHFNQTAVFESWDMLAGRMLPELGGSREHLDIVGINYYWTNQWEYGSDCRPLADDDPRRISLSRLINRVHARYRGELLITETAHVDDMRPVWLEYVADECEKLLDTGVPLRGVCLYPILGMPEWHSPETWTLMGLWDLVQQQSNLGRQLCGPMLEALRAAQRLETRHAMTAAMPS
ncbi:glycoside hydrolase [Opitutaceae bacterium EW11]|nr:glycoside hydrolase [Opitutaceae bacterium EW11]